MSDSSGAPQDGARVRARDPHGQEPITTFDERPRPNYALDPFHKGLLSASVIVAVALPVYFFLRSSSVQGDFALHYDFTGDVTREGSPQEAAILVVFIRRMVTLR